MKLRTLADVLELLRIVPADRRKLGNASPTILKPPLSAAA
jgi:hypothetical protein